MKATITAAAIVALIALGIWGYLQVTTHQYTFEVAVIGLDNDEFEVFVDGASHMRYRRSAASDADLKIQALGPKGRAFSEAMYPAITARRLTPCGWRDMPPPRYMDPDEHWTQAAIAEGRPIPLRLYFSDEEYIRRDAEVWIDNRGRGKTTLTVGQVTLPFDADTASMIYMPVDPSCPEGRKVKIDGVTVGTFPENIPDMAERDAYSQKISDPNLAPGVLPPPLPSQYFMVDTSGARCYAYQAHNYSRMSLPQPVPAAIPLEKQHLYRLESRVDYFLEDAPSAIFSDQSASSQASLVETKCRK